jgi:hypothetical protein
MEEKANAVEAAIAGFSRKRRRTESETETKEDNAAHTVCHESMHIRCTYVLYVRIRTCIFHMSTYSGFIRFPLCCLLVGVRVVDGISAAYNFVLSL